MFSWKIIGVLVLMMIAMSGAFYLYFQYSQKQLQDMAANNAKLETAVSIIEQENNKIKETVKVQDKAQKVIIGKFHEIETKLGGLDETLRKHDLKFLALKKPALIEKRINKATDKLFSTIEGETQ